MSKKDGIRLEIDNRSYRKVINMIIVIILSIILLYEVISPRSYWGIRMGKDKIVLDKVTTNHIMENSGNDTSIEYVEPTVVEEEKKKVKNISVDEYFIQTGLVYVNCVSDCKSNYGDNYINTISGDRGGEIKYYVSDIMKDHGYYLNFTQYFRDISTISLNHFLYVNDYCYLKVYADDKLIYTMMQEDAANDLQKKPQEISLAIEKDVQFITFVFPHEYSPIALADPYFSWWR